MWSTGTVAGEAGEQGDMSVGNNVAAYVFCLCEVREIYFKR